MRLIVLAILSLMTTFAAAGESKLAAEFRGERQRIAQSCNDYHLKAIGGCAVTLFTDHPLHIAVGSIAPQNGFGAGVAFATSGAINEKWRLSWNADAIGSANASWRAGGYMKFIYTPPRKITSDSTPPADSDDDLERERMYFNAYAQGISLKKIYYFGEGPYTVQAARSTFAEQQTIVGGNATVPLVSGWGLSLYGEMNGRFVNISPSLGQDSPLITQLYNNATAPGLAVQPGFLQFGEAIRLRPTLFGDHLQLGYAFALQEFTALSNSTYSFRRWSADLGHVFPLYGSSLSGPRAFNGPDQCAAEDKNRSSCPPVSTSRDRVGSIGVRLLITESIANAGSTVPFYFQPTLGGSDLNGTSQLASFQDYRFRAPNLLLLRESIEHSIWGPFGVNFVADQGKVALARSNIDFNDLRHSFAAGITVRAGGLPAIYFLFAWGGGETQHNIVSIDTSLLGGSARPPLF